MKHDLSGLGKLLSRESMELLLKRCFDLAVSLLILVMLWPIFIFIWLLIRSTSGQPALFWQKRAGLKGRPFQIVKFRTMKILQDEVGNDLEDSVRITKLGRFLRSTSLDELPTLWNVLKGDMSLVGPRPLLIEYLPLYSPTQFLRHRVKPGITGVAQVNGRNNLSWEEKFALDNWYCENQSFVLDIKILFKTIHTVLRRDGISSPNNATADRFMGS